MTVGISPSSWSCRSSRLQVAVQTPAISALGLDGVQNTDWRPSDQYEAGVTIFELLSAGPMPIYFSGSYETYCRGDHGDGGRLGDGGRCGGRCHGGRGRGLGRNAGR